MENALYDQIGRGYDRTRAADPAIATQLVACLAPRPRGRYLDLACGTGNYTLALAARGLDLVGLDQSREMLARAREKAPHVSWVSGDASRMPFADVHFAGAVCTFAAYLFDDIGAVVEEVYRVLGVGRFVLLTMAPEQVEGYWLTEYFPRAMARTARSLPPISRLVECLESVGFDPVRTKNYRVIGEVKDCFLYSAKHRPGEYLRAEFRDGISAFRLHGDAEEIAAGCERLARDVATGAIDEVIRRHPSPEGDCRFVVAEKKR